MNVDLDAQMAELKREITLRERLYPRWVQDRKLSQATADRQLEAMRSALATLERMASEGKQ